MSFCPLTPGFSSLLSNNKRAVSFKRWPLRSLPCSLHPTPPHSTLPHSTPPHPRICVLELTDGNKGDGAAECWVGWADILGWGVGGRVLGEAPEESRAEGSVCCDRRCQAPLERP